MKLAGGSVGTERPIEAAEANSRLGGAAEGLDTVGGRTGAAHASQVRDGLSLRFLLALETTCIVLFCVVGRPSSVHNCLQRCRMSPYSFVPMFVTLKF